MVIVRSAALLVATMSIPRVFLSVMEAMNPLRESSAATKYSPATPASKEVVLMKLSLPDESKGVEAFDLVFSEFGFFLALFFEPSSKI